MMVGTRKLEKLTEVTYELLHLSRLGKFLIFTAAVARRFL